MFVLVKEKKIDGFMFLLSGTIHPLAAAAACQQLLSMWLLTTHTHNTRNTKQHKQTHTPDRLGPNPPVPGLIQSQFQPFSLMWTLGERRSAAYCTIGFRHLRG